MSAPTEADYRGLSDGARALMFDIMNGQHEGTHPVLGTPAETEAIAAKCVVTDGTHIWVVQEVVEFVPGPRSPADNLRARLCDDGPIYAPIQGPEATPMLTLDADDRFLIVMENNDVGGGESIEVDEGFALAWAAQFGEETCS